MTVYITTAVKLNDLVAYLQRHNLKVWHSGLDRIWTVDNGTEVIEISIDLRKVDDQGTIARTRQI